MCEANSIWRNRVQGDRIISVDEIERPEFGEPTVIYTFVAGPDKVRGSQGKMMLEAFLHQWTKAT